MKLKGIIVIYIAVFLLSGCAVRITPMTSQKKGTIPKLNVRSVAYVGEPIYKTFNYTINEVCILDENMHVEGLFGNDVFNLPRGFRLNYSIYGSEQACCSSEKIVLDPIIGPYAYACFFDYDRDGIFDHFVTSKSIKQSFNSSIYKKATGLKYHKAMDINANMAGFQKELLFQGYVKNELKLEYREYMNSLARPAFYQNVSYEIYKNKLPTTITFKNIKITIFNIDNSKIEYSVQETKR